MSSVKHQAVEVSISEITETGVMFKLANLSDYAIVAENVTIAELFSRPDWRPVAYLYPLSSDLKPLPYFRDQRKVLDDLAEMQARLSKLYSEAGSVSDRARYDELHSVDGPIRTLDRQIKVQRLMVDCVLYVTLGRWSHEIGALI